MKSPKTHLTLILVFRCHSSFLHRNNGHTSTGMIQEIERLADLYHMLGGEFFLLSSFTIDIILWKFFKTTAAHWDLLEHPGRQILFLVLYALLGKWLLRLGSIWWYTENKFLNEHMICVMRPCCKVLALLEHRHLVNPSLLLSILPSLYTLSIARDGTGPCTL